MNKLLKDAIADAKTVRETALANAKAVLEEAFAPKLQSMLSHKIKEEMEETEEEEPAEEDQMEAAKMKSMAGISEEDPTMDSEEDMETEEELEIDSEEDVETEEEPEIDSEEDMDDEDLEEILRELEHEEVETEEEVEAQDPMMEMDSEEEEIDLEEIISALKEADEDEEEMPEGMKKKKKMMEMDSDEEEMPEGMKKKKKMMEMDSEEEDMEPKKEIEEAYRVIKFLRSKINEVNLLNAKLLFVNKLFRKGELTESQKIKVIETFDRAKNVREAKLIYATLVESVKGKSTKLAIKRKMNEGYASSPQKKTQIISESNDVYNRFKSLVGYNQNNH